VDILALVAPLLARGTLHYVWPDVSPDSQSQLSYSGAWTARAMSWVLEKLDQIAAGAVTAPLGVTLPEIAAGQSGLMGGVVRRATNGGGTAGPRTGL
jgi:hypothetical protein